MPTVSIMDTVKTDLGPTKKNLGDVTFPDAMKPEEIESAIETDVLPRLRNIYATQSEGAPSIEDASKGYVNNFRGFETEGGGLSSRPTITNEGVFGHLSRWMTGTTRKDTEKVDPLLPYALEGSKRLSEMEEAGEQDTPEYEALANEVTMLRRIKEEVPDFNFNALVKAIEDDPGAVAAEAVNAIMADPILMLTPLGWEMAAARATTKVGKVAAGAAASFTVGAGIGGAHSVFEDLDERGEVDTSKALFQGGIEGGFGVLLGGVGHGIKSAVSGMSLKSGIPEEELMNTLITGKYTPTKAKVQDPPLEGELVSDILFKQTSKKAIEGRVFDGVALRKELQKQGVTPEQSRPLLEFMDNPLGGGGKVKGKQGGKITPMASIMLAGAAVGTLGVLNSENPIETGLALVAGGATLAAGAAGLKAVMRKSHDVLTAKAFTPQTQSMIEFDGRLAVAERLGLATKNQIKTMVPSKAERNLVSHALEGDADAMKALTPDGRKAVKVIRESFDEAFEVAKKEGVITSFIDDYLPHIWKPRTLSGESGDVGKFINGITQKTAHAKQRSIASLKEGKALGLEPVTEDVAELAKAYLQSVHKAIAGKRLVDQLKNTIDVDGNKMIMNANSSKARNLGYVPINRGAFNNLLVHPDVARSVKLFVSTSDPNILRNAAMSINIISKRSLVSLSGFHMMALTESALLAGTRFRPGKMWGPGGHLSNLANGDAGDYIDFALKAGLKVSIPDDVNFNDAFYNGLKGIQDVLDNPKVSTATLGTSKILGVGVKGYEKANKVMDNIMWEKTMTWLKLATFDQKLTTAIENSGGRINAEALAAQAAEFTNDAFGGLNWARLAEETNNQIFRKIAQTAASRNGREALSLALFAPDWTTANLRIIGKAFMSGAKSAVNVGHKVLGIDGRYKIPHRSDRLFNKSSKALTFGHFNGIPVTPWERYALRAAVIYATVGGALQMALTGKPIWENERWDRLELPDGRTMVFSKQMMEPFLWAAHPLKEGLAKTSTIAKFPFEQAINKKWLAVNGRSPPIYKEKDSLSEQYGKRLGHLGSKFTPIWVSQLWDQGPDAMWGFVGHPIYGKKKENRKRNR